MSKKSKRDQQARKQDDIVEQFMREFEWRVTDIFRTAAAWARDALNRVINSMTVQAAIEAYIASKKIPDWVARFCAEQRPAT